MTTDNMTPADLAAVTGGNNGGMFGGDGAWWIIILFLFCFAGWGNGFGGGGTGATDNYVLTSDMAMLERRTDNIISGLCDGFYSQAQMNNQTNMNIAQNGYESRLATQTLGSQMAQCCCDIREGIAGINYNTATQSCATQTAIGNASRDIVDNQNANTRAILEALNAQAMEAKDQKIADMAAQIQALNLAASQAAQNNYIVNQLRTPNPIPAYSVPNPYCNCGGCGYGFNS